MQAVARMVLSALTSAPASALFRPVMRNRATIFMLHRFRSAELDVSEGVDPALLREGLELLRRRRHEIVSLAEVVRRLRGEGPPPAGAVAFTIDDGYREQALVAGPVFAAYDCPVTTFVTTGFLDGALWFWWDRIHYVFRSTRRTSIPMRLDGSALDLSWEQAAHRDRIESQFIEHCKTLPDGAKHAAIRQLATAADVELPDKPPPGSDPMSWDELRSCEPRGMTFGPHTVTHPILSRTTDEVSRYELQESWRRLSREAAAPVGVFCYPNGREGDFGSREIATLRELQLLGAVVGTRGYPHRLDPGDPEAPYRVRRVEYPEDKLQVIRYVSGIERLNLALRGYE